MPPLSPPLSVVDTEFLPIPPVVEPLPLLRPPGVVNHKPSPSFAKVAELFEAVRLERKPERRKTMLLRWFAVRFRAMRLTNEIDFDGGRTGEKR